MKKVFNPKVSVIIPVYNGSNYLKEAIDSALAQTYKNIEIIVVNDGSADNGKTDKICKSYKDKIRYFRKENGGVASALNMGIEKMEGEYFSWLSHDDIYSPEKVEKEIEVLSKLEDKKTVIYSDYLVVDEDLKEIYREELSKKFSLDKLNQPLFSLLMGYINSLTLIIHKDCFRENGLFDEELLTTQDYDMWFRILRRGNIRYLPMILTKTRIHNFQSSNLLEEIHKKEGLVLWEKMFLHLTKDEKENISGSVLQFYEDFYKHFKELNINLELQSKLYSEMLRQYVDNYFKNSKDISSEEALKRIARELECSDYGKLEKLLQSIKNLGKGKHRILFWSNSWDSFGGVNQVIRAISSKLISDFDVCIGSWSNHKHEEVEMELPPNVKFLEIDSTVIEIKNLPKLMVLVNVSLFICSQNFDDNYLSLYKAFKDLGIKTIAWDHSHYFLTYYFKWLFQVAKIKTNRLRSADLIISINSISTKIYEALGLRVVRVRDPLPLGESLEECVDIRNRPRDLIAVGRFDDYQKRLDLLLKVYAHVLKKSPQTKMYIVGSYSLEKPIKIGSSKTFAEYIKELGITENSIIFTGHIKNVNDYYKKASIHVMTSEREGFGIVIIEAANYGLPTVLFEGNGGADIVKDGENGYIIEANDVIGMSEKIVELLNDSKKLTKFSVNINKKTREYRADIVAKEWVDICRYLIGESYDDLINFIRKKNSAIKMSEEDEQIVKLYEDALKVLLEEIDNYDKELAKRGGELFIERNKNQAIVESVYWRSTYPLRKLSRLVYLFKEQGIILTVKNIFLTLKHKIKKEEK